MIGFLVGFGLCSLLVFALEMRRPRRHRLRGDYRDARTPFEIVAPHPDEHYERSEELIARTARRLMKLRETRADS